MRSKRVLDAGQQLAKSLASHDTVFFQLPELLGWVSTLREMSDRRCASCPKRQGCVRYEMIMSCHLPLSTPIMEVEVQKAASLMGWMAQKAAGFGVCYEQVTSL
jgi:hypothetical protein